VYIHIGAPKTGTTYLQQRLFRNREALARDGVLYPYLYPGQSFRSMSDFCGTGWAGAGAQQFAGEWAAVAGRIHDWAGPTAIVSNELFGRATSGRIRVGLRKLGDVEVNVVFTARDFARQIVSDWQEHIKHRHTVQLEAFVDDLLERGLDATAPFGEMFWGLHDAAYVLARWEQHVPADRIHVVTVPQPGAAKDTLWRRFCETTKLDPVAYEDLRGRSNVSMGVVETELVRRMNRHLHRMTMHDYDPLVRKVLAEKILGNRSARLTLPPDRFDAVSARSKQLITELRTRGYHVVGDLEDLMPQQDEHADHTSPSDVTDTDLAGAALRAAVGLLRHAARQRHTIAELRAELGDEPFPPVARRGSAPATDGMLVRAQAVARQLRSRAARPR
jgi:hypothetical protein